MGAILAIDFGTIRLGVAVTDPGRRFTFPRNTIRRSTPEADIEALRKLALESAADLIVVGLPFNADGSEGPMANEARSFGTWAGRALGLPVRYVDERYTTIEAEERLRDRYPKDTRMRRRLRDRAAATLILRTFLDHGPVG
jgi:putative Holliday junction resolvase